MQRRTSPYDWISLGDTTTDVFLRVVHASVHCHLKTQQCLLCVSYADKVPVEQVTELLGAGNAANNAVGAARLGLRTAIWTILGDDGAGHRTERQVFRREGIATEYVEFDARRGTNFSVVLNLETERTILVYHEERTYRLPRLLPTWLVYLTSMGKGWDVILPGLLRYLRRSGARLVFNPGTHQLRSPRRQLDHILAATHILIVNREEAGRLVGGGARTPRALLAGIQRRGPTTVVVTDGERGAYAASAGEAWHMPVVPARVVERTGAGDSFATGFTVARFFGKPLPDALLWGALNAASVIQYVGGQEGLLSRATMDRRALSGSSRARKL